MSSPKRLALDNSALVNLLACGLTAEAIALSDYILVIEERVEAEFLRYSGKRKEELRIFAESGPVHLERMGSAAQDDFVELVAAGPTDDLGDGEAGTIAHAFQTDCDVAIDDQKARNVCNRRFPRLRLIFTVELFLRPTFRAAHTPSLASEALFAALEKGRMRVPAHLVDAVAAVIGSDRVKQCESIPRHRR